MVSAFLSQDGTESLCMTELCTQNSISNLVVWNWKWFSPERQRDKYRLGLRTTLKSPFGPHAAQPWGWELWPITLFPPENVPQQQSKAFLPPPRPTSMSNESSVFTTGNATSECRWLGLWPWMPYPPGRGIFILCLSCPSLVSEGGWGELGNLSLTHLLQSRAVGTVLGVIQSQLHNFWGPLFKSRKKKQLKILKYKAYFLSSSLSLLILWCFQFR